MNNVSMTFGIDASNAEEVQFFQLLQEALHVRTHFEFLLWLQGRFQHFLPHEIMIAAWGDFSLGLIYFDIVSLLPGLRTDNIPPHSLTPMLKRLFSYWQKHTRTPFMLNVTDGILKDDTFECSNLSKQFGSMKTAVVHAIQDCRGRHDCLYVLMHSENSMPPTSWRTLEMLLPYIDSTLRQLAHLPDQVPAEEPGIEAVSQEFVGTLTAREIEIMKWVLEGKTNQEIGMIMDISTFTVKNHLQRIFKKLDVLNRAQATSKFKTIYQIQ